MQIRSIARLHDFKGPDGRQPSSGLVADPAGNLYGETELGGPGGFGTIYELSPPSTGQAAWTQTTLYKFSFGVHYFPGGGLAIDRTGALYGETYDHSCACNSVFKLSGPPAGQSAWTIQYLHQIPGLKGKLSGPAIGVVLDSTGAVYGESAQGGVGTGVCAGLGCGYLFKLTPPAGGVGDWSETTLYRFNGTGGDGAYPYGGLAIDASGSLYGTTEYGGAEAVPSGTVFRLSPPAAGGSSWTESLLHSFFSGDPYGAKPLGGVAIGPGGVLYGAASAGGFKNPKRCGNAGCGIVFELSPPPPGTTVWPIGVLAYFTGYAGEAPSYGLTIDPRGSLFGLTDNTAFELTPPASGATPWTQTVVRVFNPASSSCCKIPIGPMIEDNAGNLYGTTDSFGNNDGSVFELLNAPR